MAKGNKCSNKLAKSKMLHAVVNGQRSGQQTFVCAKLLKTLRIYKIEVLVIRKFCKNA